MGSQFEEVWTGPCGDPLNREIHRHGWKPYLPAKLAVLKSNCNLGSNSNRNSPFVLILSVKLSKDEWLKLWKSIQIAAPKWNNTDFFSKKVWQSIIPFMEPLLLLFRFVVTCIMITPFRIFKAIAFYGFYISLHKLKIWSLAGRPIGQFDGEIHTHAAYLGKTAKAKTDAS